MSKYTSINFIYRNKILRYKSINYNIDRFLFGFYIVNYSLANLSLPVWNIPTRSLLSNTASNAYVFRDLVDSFPVSPTLRYKYTTRFSHRLSMNLLCYMFH
jgi:hypothetical protein